jgi:hypothetical protein
MVFISCNAFGDIVAVVTLIYQIATALNDARGSSKDYRDLVQELRTLAHLLQNISDLVTGLLDPSLQSTVVSAVQQCCSVIGDAFEDTTTFSILGDERSSEHSLFHRVRRTVSKVDWRLRRQADAKACRLKLLQCRVHLLLALNMCVILVSLIPLPNFCAI